MFLIEITGLPVTASAEGKRKVPRQLNSIGKSKNILLCSFFGNRKIAFKNRLLNIWAYIKVKLYIIYSKAVYDILSGFLLHFGLSGLGYEWDAVFCHIETKQKYI